MTAGRDRSESALFMLEGKVAVVTGGARGYGAATARMFAKLGAAAVVILDVSADVPDELVAEIRAHGADVATIQADINDPDRIRDVAEEVKKTFERCDILVNNAGTVRWGPLEDVSVEDWDESIAVNLRGHFFCTKEFGRLMLDNGAGSIVNVTSVAAVFPEPAAGAYSPAKAALAMLTRQVAVEWGHRGVRANAVCPGLVTGGAMTPSSVTDAAAIRMRLSALGRLGESDELARVIAFLASDASSFLNGQVLGVDGGFSQMLLRVVPHPEVIPDLFRISAPDR
jgi:NAD(P)-dependent dehydrogenase (short-subunit alcohol dehydrogenase family)